MFTFLLVLHAIVAAALVTVILMQRSEGGGLTSGGSPAGLMSARGAADFLTRSTAILASVFVGLSIVLAVIAATRQTTSVDVDAVRTLPAAPPATGPAVPPVAEGGAPFAGAARSAIESDAPPTNRVAPAPAPTQDGVPLAR